MEWEVTKKKACRVDLLFRSFPFSLFTRGDGDDDGHGTSLWSGCSVASIGRMFYFFFGKDDSINLAGTRSTC